MLLLLSATACSAPNQNENTSKPDGTAATIGQQETPEETQGMQTKEELEKFKFSKVSLYCMVPEKCTRRTNGSIACTTNNKAFLATIYTGDQGEFGGDLTEILTDVAENYASNVNKYLGTNIEAEALKAQTIENTAMSGYESAKFSGQIKNIEDGNYQIYGYSMVINERPIMFLGILVSEDQADTDLAAMKAFIDQMAGSIFE